VQLLQVLRSDICTASQAERTMYEEKAIADIACALKVAEKHLKSQTFFVGERLTVADISYFAVIGAIIDLSVMDIQSLFPALFRSYMTVGSNKIVSGVVGKPSASQLAVPLNAQHGTAGSSKIDAGNFPGKWQRNRTRVKELLQKDTLMIGKVHTRTDSNADVSIEEMCRVCNCYVAMHRAVMLFYSCYPNCINTCSY
jgi:Glutathione S-transferase, C-terminal domain